MGIVARISRITTFILFIGVIKTKGTIICDSDHRKI